MPTRELYWNIHDVGHLLIYPAFIIAVIAFAYGYHQRYQMWKMGQPEKRDGSVGDVVVYGLLQKRVLRDIFPGAAHIFVFYGFIMLFITTLFVAVQADFGLIVFVGPVYIFLKLAANTLGLLAIVGIVMFWYRRYIQKSDRLDTKLGQGDGLALALIFFILVSGFIVQGLRIVGTNDPWPIYSYGSLPLAALFENMAPSTLESIHEGLWWAHMFAAMFFIGSIPYNKLSHIFLGLINQFFRKRGPIGVPETIDFEDEDLETFGKGDLREFSWKTLFSNDACIRCGRCQEICPAYASGKVLNPKGIIQDMRDHMEDYYHKLKVYQNEHADDLAQAAAEAQEAGMEPPLVKAEDIGAPALIGEIVNENAIWQCTTCRACEQVCPVFVEHVEKTGEMRRNLVLMEARFPAEAQLSFRNLENNGNPWGIGWATREDFLVGKGVPTLADKPEPEYLYWPGCFGAYDSRNQKVSVAMVKLMNAAGVDYAIIGNDEKCCGDPARRLGNEYLYFMLASENIEVMNSAGVKKIITQCPHCYNMLKSEYPQYGGNYEVIPHTEFLQSLIQQGKLSLESAKEDRSVTYHDSCYLGRYNDIYESPRSLLQKASFTDLREMAHNHDKSFCCGAGGGMMWLEEDEGERINIMRSREAADIKADVLASACPYCLTMFVDGVAAITEEGADKIQTLDIAEILAARLPGADVDSPEEEVEEASPAQA